MQCPAHFQNAAADTNTESKTNIVAPGSSCFQSISIGATARVRGASDVTARVHATRNRKRTDLSSIARQRHTTFIISIEDI